MIVQTARIKLLSKPAKYPHQLTSAYMQSTITVNHEYLNKPAAKRALFRFFMCCPRTCQQNVLEGLIKWLMFFLCIIFSLIWSLDLAFQTSILASIIPWMYDRFSVFLFSFWKRKRLYFQCKLFITFLDGLFITYFLPLLIIKYYNN